MGSLDAPNSTDKLTGAVTLGTRTIFTMVGSRLPTSLVGCLSWQPVTSSIPTANWRGAKTARHWTTGRPGTGRQKGWASAVLGPTVSSLSRPLMKVCVFHQLPYYQASKRIQTRSSSLVPPIMAVFFLSGDAAVWRPSTAQSLCAPVNSFRKQQVSQNRALASSATTSSINASPTHKSTPGGARGAARPRKAPRKWAHTSPRHLLSRPPRHLLPRQHPHGRPATGCCLFFLGPLSAAQADGLKLAILLPQPPDS